MCITDIQQIVLGAILIGIVYNWVSAMVRITYLKREMREILNSNDPGRLIAIIKAKEKTK